jgi:hypothetical protein
MITYKKGIYNELLLPFKYKDEAVTNFTARELSLPQVKQLSKIQYKSNNPFKWIAKACCWSIEEMGGVRVYEEYTKTGEFPEIIKRLPMVSTNSILVAGHIKTMGEVLEEIPGVCPNCGSKEENEIDLMSIEVPHFEEEEFESKICVAELSVGYVPSKKAQADLQLAKSYPNLTFRLPVLQDVLKLETAFLEAKDISDFFEELMGQCLIKLESASGDPLPDNLLSMRKGSVLGSLSPRDWKKARKEYNKNVPELNISTKKSCSDCGKSITYNVEQNFLFL